MERNEPLKILQVVGAMNRAGTETMLMNIYRTINREKVQFDFISYSSLDAHYDKEITELGGNVIKVKKTNSIKAIYQIIRQYGPYDAVHAHTLFHCGLAMIAAFLAGVKVRISHAHTTLDDNSTLLRKWYMTCMRWVINRFSTNALACSKEAGRYLFGEKRAARRAYTFFPNVIDYTAFLQPNRLEVNTFKVEAGLGNSIVIGHIGRFIEAKNHAFLLEIMKILIRRVPSIKLLLVGDGDLRKQIENEAAREGLLTNIKFVGIRKDIATALHSMNVFVFPSLYEGLGLVLLEAQASGVPCVVSEAIQPEADLDIGLISRLSLTDGPESWADHIIELTDKRERNKQKITAGFEDNGYSLEKGIAALMNLYQPQAGGAYEETIDRFL